MEVTVLSALVEWVMVVEPEPFHGTQTTLRVLGEVGRKMDPSLQLGRKAEDRCVWYLSVHTDLQVLLPAGFHASPFGPWIPEPLVPGAASEKLQP